PRRLHGGFPRHPGGCRRGSDTSRTAPARVPACRFPPVLGVPGRPLARARCVPTALTSTTAACHRDRACAPPIRARDRTRSTLLYFYPAVTCAPRCNVRDQHTAANSPTRCRTTP